MNRRRFISSIGIAFATFALTTRLAKTELLPRDRMELNEKSLEEILIEIKNYIDEQDVIISILPTRIIWTSDLREVTYER